MTDLAAAGREPGMRRFLTCCVAERLYAIPAGDVAEIVRTPAVAWVPQGPAALLGVANVRGAVVPVAGLRELLGMLPDATSEASRTVILQGESPVGLVVDAVQSLVSIPVDRLKTSQAEFAATPGEPLLATFTTDAGEPAGLVDMQNLLKAAFIPAAAARSATSRRASPATDRSDAVAEIRRKLVTFEVAGQEFGLDLAMVREIVVMPASVARSPEADAAVVGVIAYRDGLLPILSLRSLLGFGLEGGGRDREKIVVTLVGPFQVGLVVDKMRAVLAVDPTLMDQTPPILAARAGGETQIKSIYRCEGGRRLVSVLAPEQLFREDVMQRLGDENAAVASVEGAVVEGDAMNVVVFHLGDAEFGLPVDSVEEVGRVSDKITLVPNTPPFLEGVINLRGEIVPVVDQRRRFGMPALESKEGRRLIIVRTERHRAGLIVDAASEVLRTTRDHVEPPPEIVGEINRLTTGVLNLADTGRLVLLLDPVELLTRAETGLVNVFVGTLSASG